MTPKEKAKELFTKYSNYFTIWDAYSDCAKLDKWGIEYTKLSAILCVDEIINACEINMVECYNTDWWNKVKQELELL